MTTSRSVVPRRSSRSTVLSSSESSRITPLGKPVVPDVYMMSAVSVGRTASALARRGESSTLRARSSTSSQAEGVAAVPEGESLAVAEAARGLPSQRAEREAGGRLPALDIARAMSCIGIARVYGHGLIAHGLRA